MSGIVFVNRKGLRWRDVPKNYGQPCIPGWKSRNEPGKCNKRRYRQRSRIEVMFGRLKDWSRVPARYDRCPTALFSTINSRRNRHLLVVISESTP